MKKDVAPNTEIIARLPTPDEWSAMGGSNNHKRWSGYFASKLFQCMGRPVGGFFEQAGIYGHQDLVDGVWEWIDRYESISERS